MPLQDDTTRDSVQPYAEQWAAESLFIGETAEERAPVVDQWYQAHTPFREKQELEEMYSSEAEEEDHFTEPEDEEPDEEAYESMDEASELELYQEPPAGEDEYPVTQSAGTERPLQEYFGSLVEEAKTLLDNMASDLRRYGRADMSEAEIEALLNQYQPAGIHLPQGFEYLLDDIQNMARRFLKGTATLTKLQTRQAGFQPISPFQYTFEREQEQTVQQYQLNTTGARRYTTVAGLFYRFPVGRHHKNNINRPQFQHPESSMVTYKGVGASREEVKIHPAVSTALHNLMSALRAEGARVNDESMKRAVVASGFRAPTEAEGRRYLQALKKTIAQNPTIFGALTFPSNLEDMARSELGFRGAPTFTAFRNAIASQRGWNARLADLLLSITGGFKAPRGASTHHSGLAVDINFPYVTSDSKVQWHSMNRERNADAFRAAAGVWLNANAPAFGFDTYKTKNEIWHQEWRNWAGTPADPTGQQPHEQEKIVEPEVEELDEFINELAEEEFDEAVEEEIAQEAFADFFVEEELAAEESLDELYDQQVSSVTDVTFPSGESLRVIKGPEKPGEEYHDPNNSGNPLLDTSGQHRKKKLSKNFTVGELARSGNTNFDKARIDPELVTCLQVLRDFVRTSILVIDGYYSYKYLLDLVKRERLDKIPYSPHLSGQGAKIRVEGLSGLELAKAAVISCGKNHLDPKVSIGTSTIAIYVKQKNPEPTSYIKNGEQKEQAIKTIRQYRDQYYNLPKPLPKDIAVRDVPLSESEKVVVESVIKAMNQPNPIAGASDVDQAFIILNDYSLPFLVRVLAEVYDRGYFHGLLGYLAPGTKANNKVIVAIRFIQCQKESSSLTLEAIKEAENYLEKLYDVRLDDVRLRLPDDLKFMPDCLEHERIQHEIRLERQNPGVRQGSKTLTQGTMDWLLLPLQTYSYENYRGQPSARIQIMFTPNRTNRNKTITFLQTVLQMTNSSGSTKSIPLLDIGRDRPFDPFYGADFSTEKKEWLPEEAPKGFKNAPSSTGDPAAYLYDEPSVPPTQTKMFESVVVVPATGEVLGALRWGVSWGKSEAKVLGAEESKDCTDAPSADFGIALNRFYATPKTVDIRQSRPIGEEHYDAILDGFIANEATLTSDHRKQLDSIVEQLKKFSSLSVVVGGFADESEKDPFGISQQRAAKVKTYLIDHGVQKERIESCVFGATWVRYPPSAKENRNRRVQILLRVR